MLRVHELSFTRSEAEESGVKLIAVVDRSFGLDEVRMIDPSGIDAGALQLVVAEEFDRLDTVTQVPPVFSNVLRAREAARHTDNGHTFDLIHSRRITHQFRSSLLTRSSCLSLAQQVVMKLNNAEGVG